MKCEMIVEQLGSQEYRMRYVPETQTFVETANKYLGYARHFVGIYGWIVGYGTPPGMHIDVMVPTSHAYSLGEAVPVRVVGCFRRGDGDNKYVAVEALRSEWTLSELPANEREMLSRLYPEIRLHDAWLECTESVELLKGQIDLGETQHD